MWEIYAYHNTDSLFGIFNAAAAIHASNDYMSAVAAVAFCGFAAALFAYAFAPEKLQGWKWLGTVVMVFSLLILPKADVGIVDKTGGAPVKVVSNVPLGIAALGGITSTIGHTITSLFETAFQTLPSGASLPVELAYSQHGMMFGNRLIRTTGQSVFMDPAFRTDLVNFIHNCTMYDLIDGTVNPASFSQSDDVWSMMSTPNPARFSTLNTSTGSQVAPCPSIYSALDSQLGVQVSAIEKRLASQLNPTLSATVASTVIGPQIQQAFIKANIASATATAADLIRQNAMLNAIEDTAHLAGQKVNDPSAILLGMGRSQAVAQQNATWLNSGKIAEQSLPVIRNVIEAITYAIFPALVLLILLTSGRDSMLFFKGYCSLLIWIQLWPPIFAVCNFMAAHFAAMDLAAAADLGAGVHALSLRTGSTIYSRAVSGEAIVGYLALSIPVLAWAGVKGFGSMGTAFVGGLSGLQATIGSSTAGATAGNVSLGNVSMDQQQLAPNRTSAFMSSWQNDRTGDTVSSNMLTGRTAVSLLRNVGFASRVVTMSVSQQDVTDASRQVDAARSEAVSASTERSAALSDAFTKGIAKLRSARSSSGSTSGSYEELGETLNKVDQISQSIAKTTGLSQSQVANIALGASARAGLGTGKSVLPVSAGLEAETSLQKSYLSGLSDQEQKVLANMSNEQLAAFRQFGDRVSRDRSFASVVSDDSRQAEELSARLSTTQSRSERAEANLSERTAFSERVSSAHSRGEAISIDIAQDPHNVAMFMRYVEQYGGNSAAAQTMMSSELARQALKPNRVLSDGTALPHSFEDVQRRASQERDDVRLSPNLTQVHQENLEQTEQRLNAQPKSSQRTEVPTLRQELRGRGEQIRGDNNAATAAFEAKAEIEQTDDGTLKSRKSLTVQSGKQVGSDAAATLDNASELLSKLKK